MVVDEYLELTRVSRREETLNAEVSRIRNSFSFQFGNIFVKAIERPLTLPLLPFNLLIFLYRNIRKKKNTTKPITKITRNCIVGYSAESPRGVHYDRMETILKELRKAGIQTVHVTNDREIRDYEYIESHALYSIPSRKHFPDMIPRTWNRKLEHIFAGILDTFHPRTVIFDGDYPFRGLLNAISLRSEMNRFWIRESLLSFKISSLPIDAFETFDATIHPIMNRRDDPDSIIGKSGTIFCNPILDVSHDEKALARLRTKVIQSQKKVIFVQLSKSTQNIDSIFEQLISSKNAQILCSSTAVPKKYRNHKKITTYHDISTSNAIQIADLCFISPDFFNIYSCFSNRKPTMCLVDSKQNLDIISREFGSSKLPVVLIDGEQDSAYISDGIERLSDGQFQEQLIQRMSEMNIQSGTKELCNYLRSLHESNQIQVDLDD